MSGGAGAEFSADPVRGLMERHRSVAEGAVHPLEIAAALEAEGIGPGTGARYRHADVFSLAEELYARVPRRPAPVGVRDPESPWRRRALRSLGTAAAAALPCAGYALAVDHLPSARARALVAAALLALLVLVVFVAAGTGELRQPAGGRTRTGRPDATSEVASLVPGRAHHGRGALAARCGYALGSAGLVGLVAVRAGGTDARALAVALAAGLGSAEWAARWFAHLGWGHLGAHRGRAEFRARMRPVLPVAAACHLSALAACTFAALLITRRDAPPPGGTVTAAVAAAGETAWAAQAALGAVLFGSTLLWRCGRPRSAAAAALAACAAVLAAGRLAPAIHLPGGPAPATAQLFGAGAAALLLLPCAWAVLLRPEAHHRD